MPEKELNLKLIKQNHELSYYFVKFSIITEKNIEKTVN